MKRAIIAVAHSMLIIGYHMLKTKQAYQELGGNYLDRIQKESLQRYHVKKLQNLGFTVSIEPSVVVP